MDLNNDSSEPWLTHYAHGCDWRTQFAPLSLPDMFAHSAAAYPARSLVDFLGRQYSYDALYREAQAFAAWLQSTGIARGDRVGLYLPNVPIYVSAYYGAAMAGATLVNFSPLYTAEELAAQVRDSGTRLLVTLDVASLLPTAVAVLDSSPLEKLIVSRLADQLPWPKAVALRVLGRKALAPVPQRRETGLTAVGTPRRLVIAPHAASRPAPLQSGEQVAGRVLIVSAPVSEPVDPDHWKWLAIPAWGLVLLISPVAAGIIAWMTAGPLAAAVVVFICISILRFTFSDRLLQSWQFVAALRGRHIVESVPNVSIRLRAADDHEVQLRVKGRLNAGSVVEGDRIRADGGWRSGVFHVSRLHCARTGAMIVPMQPNSKISALVGVSMLIVVALWLSGTGVPWVFAKFHHLRPLPTRVLTEFLRQ